MSNSPEMPDDVAPRRTTSTARWAAIGVGVVVIALLGVLFTRKSAIDRATRSPLLGTIAPDFAGTSVLDPTTRFSLADTLSGEKHPFVVLNFFASWCVPCAIEHPQLNAFAKAHAAAGDATVVSVVFQDQADDVKNFFAARGGSWPVLDSDRTAVDYGVTGVPETFLIDPDGVVIAKWNGAIKRSALEQAMKDYVSVNSAGATGSTGSTTPGTPAP